VDLGEDGEARLGVPSLGDGDCTIEPHDRRSGQRVEGFVVVGDGGPVGVASTTGRCASIGASSSSGTDQSGRPERHRTLAATIAWSHDLLSDAARRLLCRLAVFAGRFGLEAVEAVSAAGVPLEAVDVLGDLVDKSLVVAQHEGSVTTYRLLETVRLNAADHLAGSDDEEPARRAHGRWFLSRLESIPWDQRLFEGLKDRRERLAELIEKFPAWRQHHRCRLRDARQPVIPRRW
jgi:predicted ATPase